MGRLAQTVISKHFDLEVAFKEMCLARPDFIEAVKGLRLREGIMPNLFQSDNPLDDNETNSYFDNSKIDRSVRSLLKRFNLPEGWFEVAYFYVISGSFVLRKGMYEENSGGLVIEEESDRSPEITLRVGADVTRSDFMSAWEYIQKCRGKGRRNSSRSNVVRDFRIFELHREGKTIVEICRTIKDECEEDLDYGNVKKIIHGVYERYSTPSNLRQTLPTN